ncbi:MAG: hypothetical protein LDL41_12980 [Coleofasciculus sp. S288]|nr:hypothetical protein [Coleofasciculus sp. S288]
MYDSELSEMNCHSSNLEALLQEAQKLSVDEKAELVERLLGKESGLIVVSQSTHLADFIIAQMNLLSNEGLAYVLRAIADELASEGHPYRNRT